MFITYQTLLPYGMMDGLYLGLNDPDLATLDEMIDFHNSEVNNLYVNNFLDDNIGNETSYLISRINPDIKFKYSVYTPNNQMIEIKKYTHYNSSDGVLYNDCVNNLNPTIDYDAHPELLPEECFIAELITTYYFPIDHDS